MAADVDAAMNERKNELLDIELDKFMSGINTSSMRNNHSGWF